MKGQQHLQVVHHHRSRHERLVEQQALNVLGHQICSADAHRCKTITACPCVRRVFALREKVQERARLNIGQGLVVQLARELVKAIKEKILQVLDGVVPRSLSCVIQHLVQMLRSAVVARMLGVAKAVGVAVQRAGASHCGVLPPPVNDVHQVGFDPARDDVAVL